MANDIAPGNISNPFVIFPEEIWELILHKLETYEDCCRAIKVNPFLAVLLVKKRQLWMFEKIIPHIFPYLDVSSVLNCRLVCSKWNTGVLRFLNRNPSLWPVTVPPDPSFSSPAFELFDGLIIDQSNIDSLHTDLDKRDHFRVHPYPSRQISIDWRDEEETPSDSSDSDSSDDEEEDNQLPPAQRIEQYWNKCHDLLDDFQAHIHHINISVEGGLSADMTDAVFYMILQKSLSRLPKIQSVVIEGNLGLFCNPHHLTRFSKRDPLPVLPDLKSFSLEIADLPVKFERLIYQAYGPQLTKIRMLDCLLEPKFTPHPTIHFTQLHLHSTQHEVMTGSQMHEIFSRLTFPNLEKLTLEIKELLAPSIHIILQSCPRLRWLKIMSQMPVKSYISLPETASQDVWKKHFALKWLQVEGTILETWEFLGCTPALQYLQIEEEECLESLLSYGKVTVTEESNLDNDPAAEETVYYSEIWTILPNLKEIIYQREDEDGEVVTTKFIRACQ